MRRKALPARSCTAAVAGCSLLNLIFNQNSTTENHSLKPSTLKAIFKLSARAGEVAEIWVHQHIYAAVCISSL